MLLHGLSLSVSSPQISWSRTGKYLGLYVGPGKGEKSWDKPFQKFLKRLGEWDWPALGLQESIRIYNIYILPVITYVSQFERLPVHLLRHEAFAVRRLAPGVGDWISPHDLHHGRALGLATVLRPMEITCRASMLRFRTQEGGAGVS